MNETNIDISNTTTENSNDSDHPDIMTKVIDFRDNAHADNVRKLKAGIKCIFTIPACFLILLFFTNSSKIIFLVLWIVSLFLIAAYLIHVEYSDYKLQEMVNSLQDTDSDIDSLIDIDSIYTKVSAPKRKLDQKVDTIITNAKADAQAQLDTLSQIRSNIRRENEVSDMQESTDLDAAAAGAEPGQDTVNGNKPGQDVADSTDAGQDTAADNNAATQDTVDDTETVQDIVDNIGSDLNNADAAEIASDNVVDAAESALVTVAGSDTTSDQAFPDTTTKEVHTS